ncbi:MULTISPECIES: DNA-binding transcriptional activator BglJ [Atlantibacter]|uniref:DNA-binding transcriptional activator BglJ n=1 Tax=Atlantibacter TaxID=1903434 RepID=UPI0019315B6B|nr:MULTISPECIES: DNA-binding transcriptional activator BglJ [Atlantibacter]MBL7634838.1 DNA-binding transcriptional activator BglJ [Atlantibacter hermannii]MBL7676424.1 DNA-binding transcriptional activator BglJ [Atlantibacter hermannii]MCZ7833010.1 DNA-binding transcriptional activator BglJ [Atlantibacter hermannii]
MEQFGNQLNIAVFETCALIAAGMKALFAKQSQYHIIFFNRRDEFMQMQTHVPFHGVIFSLSGSREHRRECLQLFSEIASLQPNLKRIVMVNGTDEAKLITQLSQTIINGVVNKDSPVTRFYDELSALLNDASRTSDANANHWYISNSPRLLSPTERIILRYLTDGYSVSQIASCLERNIKTIRAHKFNAMLKLGVNNDAGLLDAADILRYRNNFL